MLRLFFVLVSAFAFTPSESQWGRREFVSATATMAIASNKIVREKGHSPTLAKFSSLSLNKAGLVVIDQYKHNGDVLVEVLGPKDIKDAAPLVISVGHGGRFKPKYVPTRTEDKHPVGIQGAGSNGFAKVSDANTDELGFATVSATIDNWNLVPYFVINHLHRSKVDTNRYIDVAAQGNPIAEGAWNAFHDFISQAQVKVKQKFGTVTGRLKNGRYVEGVKGLLIDLHGYAGANDWRSGGNDKLPFIHWGYNMEDSLLDKRVDDIANSTLTHMSSMPDLDLESLIRGENSLGTRFYNVFQSHPNSTGYPKIGLGLPSKEFPNPYATTMDPIYCGAVRDDNCKRCKYFSGGFTIIYHEYLDWRRPNIDGVRMNTVQIELPRPLRSGIDGHDKAFVHDACAYALSISSISLVKDVFQIDSIVSAVNDDICSSNL